MNVQVRWPCLEGSVGVELVRLEEIRVQLEDLPDLVVLPLGLLGERLVEADAAQIFASSRGGGGHRIVEVAGAAGAKRRVVRGSGR
jgi:hypothetical protein